MELKNVSVYVQFLPLAAAAIPKSFVQEHLVCPISPELPQTVQDHALFLDRWREALVQTFLCTVLGCICSCPSDRYVLSHVQNHNSTFNVVMMSSILTYTKKKMTMINIDSNAIRSYYEFDRS